MKYLILLFLLTGCSSYRCAEYQTIISIDHCSLYPGYENCVVTTSAGQKHTVRNLDNVEYNTEICVATEEIR
jgi:hypothetical protein